MKQPKIVIVFFIFILVGIATFAQILAKMDEKQKMQDIHNKGNSLVSLIATHSIEKLKADKRDIFLRTLAANTSPAGLAYCFIHDESGRPLVTLAPPELSSCIPETIQATSLYSMGLIKQKFKLDESQGTFYEFAKPVFENGSKTGVVRVGLNLPRLPIFSMERISLISIIAFLIFAAVTFVYYAITLALRPFARINECFIENGSDPAPIAKSTSKSQRINHIIEEFEGALGQLKGRLQKMETDNVELASRLGAASFEKNQVINILDSINFGIVITDIQDNISHINAYMLHMINKELKEVRDCPLHEVLPYEEITAFTARHEAVNPSQSPSNIEITFPDLSPRETFRISLSYLQDDDGAAIGKIISIKNITAEKLGEEAQKEFIAHISHELMTPLTTIKSYNEMLMDEEIDDGEIKKEFYNTINDETSRLKSLIQNLLNISKIEMGGLSLNNGLVRTDWLFNDCLGAVEASAKKKQITIEKILPGNFPTLVGDKELLKVAINNILSNAVKYTPEKGTITFSLTEVDNQVICEIIDTGYGISKDDLPHIFKKSFRSTDAQIREQNGSGFGLAITSEIINLHGGLIEVQSESDKGTHFTISIPKEEYYLENQ
jgi:signal transduction histidine kinase